MKEVRLDLFKLHDENNDILMKIPNEIRKNLINQINESKLKNKKKIQIYKKAMKLHNNGLGKRRISKILDCHTSTVESWLYEGSKPNPKINISSNTILQLKQAGLRNKEIGKLLSVHPHTILQRVKPRKIRENKVFQISEKAGTFIKTQINPINFIKYFWISCSKKEIESFGKFCNFIRLKDELAPRELARSVEKSYSVTYNWRRGKDLPRLVRWLEVFISLGEPKRNFLWLPINLGSSGTPLNPIIQVPKKIMSWKDVEQAILQLKLNDDILPTITKEECFGFILGMIVGDTSKPTSNRDSLALYLTKNSTTNELLGEFFCQCLKKLGFKAYRVKDSENKYKWSTQSSPFFSWIYKISLGLKEKETTTYYPIKAGWLLDAPIDFIRRFLQGVFESDGSISYTGMISCSTFPNTELIQNLLKRFGIVSYIIQDGKWKKLVTSGNKQIEKCHNLVFAPEIRTQRYKLLEKIVSAEKTKKNQKLPQEIRDKIKLSINEGLKDYRIVKKILLENNYFISRSSIGHYRNFLKVK